LNVLIIDDERPLADYLASLLANERPDWQLTVMSDSLQALEVLSTQNFDVVFCDIHMPMLSGLTLLQLNQQLAHPCPYWVFITAYDDYAIQAFELAAIDYLLKPIQLSRLQQTLSRVTKQQHQAEILMHFNENRESINAEIEWLKLSHGNQVKLIHIEDIHYFQAEDKLVGVYNTQLQGWIRKSIKTLSDQLPKQSFMQVHRSLIVRIQHIESAKKDEFGHWHLLLKSGISLPISRQFQRQFKGD
jgi:DNA-binding LytR/AlgR family response regulator